MTGRLYLDWNASAPLRPEARAAAVAALDVLGNPSSVHAEGRRARALVETAREQVAALVGCAPAEVIFTSGATEAAALRLSDIPDLIGAGLEHPAVAAHLGRLTGTEMLAVDAEGRAIRGAERGRVALQAANSETGVLQAVTPEKPVFFCDATQAAGRIPFAFDGRVQDSAVVSGHKFGGPKGVGALILRAGVHLSMPGGGQEMGRRSGTENLAGIAGMGAAAEAAARDLASGAWEEVRAVRDAFEEMILSEAPGVSIVGRGAERLPNTTLLLAPGWRGETQVMQMDLAGFAVSAGAACSSGKARPIGALSAMGVEPGLGACALRVSIGPGVTGADMSRFAAAWLSEFKRRAKTAA
ncbi:cysteine desulfurase family protein [Rhodovulum sp. DZ06]|uniref:cysteine desulfurase family protein n=1 Tax=Rhodovulum sp. DZ06 TaxID=3425126 RepID=UPI003D32A00A